MNKLEFIDSHFHIETIIEKGMDIEKEIEKCRGFLLLDIGLDVFNIENKLNILENLNSKYGIKFFKSLGIFPSDCDNENIDEMIAILQNNIKLFDFVGEIGLDYYKYDNDKKNQISLFERQIEIANANDKPIILHIRQSFADVISTLKSNKAKKSGIAHCFSGDYTQAKELIDLGFLISFSGNITYKNSDLINVFKNIPLSSVLFETDSPFLSPVKLRGTLNTPKNVEQIYEYVSCNLNIDMYELCENVKANFNRILLK